MITQYFSPFKCAADSKTKVHFAVARCALLQWMVWSPCAALTGACEGTLACSTCHLIFEDHIYEKLDAITDEENDMLDLAFGLTDR
jgi:ferredoxin